MKCSNQSRAQFIHSHISGVSKFRQMCDIGVNASAGCYRGCYSGGGEAGDICESVSVRGHFYPPSYRIWLCVSLCVSVCVHVRMHIWSLSGRWRAGRADQYWQRSSRSGVASSSCWLTSSPSIYWKCFAALNLSALACCLLIALEANAATSNLRLLCSPAAFAPWC